MTLFVKSGLMASGKDTEFILVVLFFTVLFGVFTIVTHDAYAATVTADESGNWNVGATWDTGTVPALSDTVIIPSPFTVTITTAVGTQTGPVTVNSGGNLTVTTSTGTGLTIGSGGSLTNNGSIRISITGGTSGITVNSASGSITNNNMMKVTNTAVTGLTASAGSVTNLGTIIVSPTGGTNGISISGTGSFVNKVGKTIYINGTGATSPIRQSGSGTTFTNSGTINISGSIGGTAAILTTNTATFNNNGTLTMTQTSGNGINNNSSAGSVSKTINTVNGTITMSFSSTGNGIENLAGTSYGNFTNRGIVIMTNTAGVGIQNNGATSGSLNTFTINHNNMTIKSSGAGVGIQNAASTLSEGRLVNSGTIRVNNTGTGSGIKNAFGGAPGFTGNVTNMAAGIIKLSNTGSSTGINNLDTAVTPNREGLVYNSGKILKSCNIGTVTGTVPTNSTNAIDSLPCFTSAAYNSNTGVLTITFSESIDTTPAANVDLSKLFISATGNVNEISLSGASVTEVDGATITITLTAGQKTSVNALATRELDIVADSVQDLAANKIESDPNNAITASAASSSTPSDSLSLADALSVSEQSSRSQSETIGITDTVTVSKRASVSLTESQTLTDTVVASKSISVLISDTLLLADAMQTSNAKQASDSISLTDSITVSKSVSNSITESLPITDVITTSKSSTTRLSESLSLADAVSTTKSTTLLLTETLPITDAITTSKSKHLPLSESLSLADAVSTTKSTTLLLTETLSVTDAVMAKIKSVSQSETVTLEASVSSTKVEEGNVGPKVTVARLISPNKIVVEFNKNVTSTLGSYSAITIGGDAKTVTAHSVIGKYVTLTITANATVGQTGQMTLADTIKSLLGISFDTSKNPVPIVNNLGNEPVLLNSTQPTIAFTVNNSPVTTVLIKDGSDAKFDLSVVPNKVTSGGKTNVTTNKQLDVTYGKDTTNQIDFRLPANTTISGSSGSFTGIIDFPERQSTGSCPPQFLSTDSLVSCVDVGKFGVELTLDKPARLLLKSEGAHSPYYGVTSSTLRTKITNVCNADDFNTVSAQLSSTGSVRECYIVSNNDMVIWTMHFTSFGTIRQSTSSGSSASSASTSASGNGPINVDVTDLTKSGNYDPDGFGSGISLIIHSIGYDKKADRIEVILSTTAPPANVMIQGDTQRYSAGLDKEQPYLDQRKLVYSTHIPDATSMTVMATDKRDYLSYKINLNQDHFFVSYYNPGYEKYMKKFQAQDAVDDEIAQIDPKEQYFKQTTIRLKQLTSTYSEQQMKVFLKTLTPQFTEKQMKSLEKVLEQYD